MDLHVSPSPDDTAQSCAAHLLEGLAQAIDSRDIARIALAGGRTPRMLYHHLVQAHRDALDWSRVEFYFGDERIVPLDHPESNFRMAQESLFSGLGVHNHQLFPMISGERHDPQQEADRYESLLRRWASQRVPQLDIALLGMGSDGHFASLFPGTPALDETDRLVVVNPVEKLHGSRLTMTFPMFLAARSVMFLVTGQDKAPALRAVLAGDSALPAGQLMNQRDADWFVDEAAMSAEGP
ncbi:MAG: 6-phosphogluconolactonase [Halothiobacillaceae bacterium]